MTGGEHIHRKIWFFDFDGTLAPIVADRHAAQMHPACREFLQVLSKTPRQCVAVLSSRKLEDLQARMDLPNIYIGGYNGLKWITPQHRELNYEHCYGAHLQANRAEMLPLIEALKILPGLDIEDKHWSLTLHLRRMPSDAKEEVLRQIRSLQNRPGIRILRGPEAWEIIFSESFNKSSGIRLLCTELKFSAGKDSLIYAGDDANDALAMETVAAWGGINITVGPHPLHPGSRLVDSPGALATMCRLIAHDDAPV